MSAKNKKSLSEQDICSKYVLPAIVKAGWDLHKQIREQMTFTAGRIIVKGKFATRGEKKRADFILYYKNNFPIAIIEAKDNNHSVGSGMQQALDYAETLDIPFVYSTNGNAFLEHDRLSKSEQKETEISMDTFPSPEELYARYIKAKGVSNEQQVILDQEYHQEIGGRSPRYFQQIAINRTFVKEGDIIFATTRPYLKNIIMIPDSLSNSVASTGFCVIRSNKKIVDPSYVYYVVDSDYFLSKIIPLQRGATYPAVSDTDIYNQKIPLPPLSEQRKIVKYLDSLSEKVRKIQTLQSETERELKLLEKAVLSKAFVV